MTRGSLAGTAGLWLVMAALAFMLAGCDENSGGGGDAGDDTTVADTATDPFEDPVPPCPYPEGPYAFSAEGDITPMMYWPTGIPGLDESAPAHLGHIRCEEGVNSIFMFIYGQT